MIQIQMQFYLKKINAVGCHSLLHITNNKFASPIVQIGATPDYELFKNQLQNFLLQSPLTIEVDKRLFSYSVQSFTFLVWSYVFIFIDPIHLVKDNVV